MHKFEVTGETTFHASHFLRHYRGASESPHEHDYRVRIGFVAEALDEDDISVDFLDVERILNEIKVRFDNCDINSVVELADRNPTAENLALLIGNMVMDACRDMKDSRLQYVEIWELSNVSVRVNYEP